MSQSLHRKWFCAFCLSTHGICWVRAGKTYHPFYFIPLFRFESLLGRLKHLPFHLLCMESVCWTIETITWIITSISLSNISLYRCLNHRDRSLWRRVAPINSFCWSGMSCSNRWTLRGACGSICTTRIPVDRLVMHARPLCLQHPDGSCGIGVWRLKMRKPSAFCRNRDVSRSGVLPVLLFLIDCGALERLNKWDFLHLGDVGQRGLHRSRSSDDPLSRQEINYLKVHLFHLD